MSKLKKVEIDEIELYLNYFKQLYPEKIANLNYEEIAKLIQEDLLIECSKEDIYLIYETSIQDEQYDMEYFYKQVLGL